MLTGLLKPNNLNATEAPVQKETSEIFSVQVEQYDAKTIIPELVIHGQTAPNRSVEIKAEIAGKVLKINAREGDYVKKDQIIIEIDPRDKKEQLDQAKALLKQRKVEHQANQSLIDQGLQNKPD